MVGGRNFAESHFNRAVQARRQPGSAFKPFVYAAALEAGLTPATMIQNLNAPISLAAGDWTPEDEHSTADALSLRSALRTSSNRAAVQLLQQVGIPRAVDYARSLGVGDVPAVPSLALGSGEVTLQALTAAYAAFANRGLVVEPVLIRRVEDRAGEVLFAAEPRATPAVSETTAFLMASMLADVLDSGTAAGARRMGFTLPAAGKTGTTNDFKDAWFVGFTPTLVAGVWVGFDQPRPILRNGFAAEVAVPLWAGFMKAATRGQQAAWLRPPSAITTATVCRLSGHLATEGCEHVEVLGEDGRSVRRSMAYTEYFVNGSEPRSVCTLHPTRGFIGALAAVFAGGSRPAPPVVREADLPAEVVRPSPAPFPTPKPHPPAADAEPSPRRRGFWSRVLGIGREDPKEPEKRRRDPRQR
jgi:membrane carboxypeptidase/penicillin-binding protein